MFIYSFLELNLQGHGYGPGQISTREFHRAKVWEQALLNVNKRPFYTQEHLPASAPNIKSLEKHVPKFVLHLRDPRQGLVSWFFDVERYQYRTEVNKAMWSKEIQPPQGYYDWNLEKRQDWQIENYLPVLIGWLSEWKAVVQTNTMNILVTRHEDLAADSQSFLLQIAEFFNLDTTHLQFPVFQPGTNIHHARKGLTDEWKTFFNNQQKRRIAEIVPVELLEYFDWDPNPALDE